MLNRRQFILSATAFAILTACTKTKKYARLNSGSTVLALGDSLTAGYGAAKGEDYPSQLAQLTGWNVVNGGVSGDTSAQALARLPDLMAQHQPKLVIVSIGGNDFLRKIPENTTRNNIGKILSHIQAAKVPVVLVAIPFFTVGALVGMVSEHELYDNIAQQYNVPLLKGAWAEVLGNKNMKSDQIHGNAAGYRFFAEQMHRFLQKHGFK